jgi:thiamine-monophosphate kinase
MDPVVEGVHFDANVSPARIGRKLVHRNFSDLAAMGAWPDFVLASFCFGPRWTTARRRLLYRAVHAAASRYRARWVGGDLARVPSGAVLTMCAAGHPAGPRPIPRSGLRPGHLLFVTGPLGGSRASGHHLDFEPRLAWGRRLARRHGPSAMIDVSDGLALDLARMLRESGGVGATLDAAAIPLRQGADLRAGLTEGEDHELLFGLPPCRLPDLRRDRVLPAVIAVPIGVAEHEPGLRLRHPDGRVESLAPGGFQHEFA